MSSFGPFRLHDTSVQKLYTECCRLVKDKKYGSMDKNVAGGWNGMIGELVRKVGVIRIKIVHQRSFIG